MTISDLQYWNQRDFAGLDLVGVDFSGYRLENADFSGADLTGANLYCADLSGANFAGATLVGANLTGCNITGAHFDYRHRGEADFSNTYVDFAPWTVGHIVELEPS